MEPLVKELPAAAKSVGTWSHRAITHLSDLVSVTQLAATLEMRNVLLEARIQQLEAQAAPSVPGAGEALALRAEAEHAGLKRCLEQAGLVWNDEASTVHNIESAFAWLRLAIDQERDTSATLKRELDEALRVNDEDLKEACEEAAHRKSIMEARWKITDLPWEPAQTFAWNVVNTIEVLAKRAAGMGDLAELREQVATLEAQLEEAGQTPDAAHLAQLQEEVVRLNDELKAAKKSPTPAPADSRAARDLAKLLDALGTPDVAVALRKLKGAASPGPASAEAPSGPTCRGCGEVFERTAKSKWYCTTCRPLTVEESTIKESAARSKGLNPKCATCKHGVPSKHSEIGWECLAYKARDCVPLLHGHHYERGEGVMG